ncbi:MAG: 50S ribosomal protein L3 [Candidatus Moranbacteria bacterium]|jgi:large subunit ribosomal protein L3|nr:50S ribosomal protein L3 [Candidatus Moranbacteria bacterium]
MKFLIGKKLGMTTLHEGVSSENVTLVSCEPNVVTLVRTLERDGYAAVQVEAKKTTRKTVKKEFRPPFTAKGKDEISATGIIGEPKVGDSVSLSIFEPGDIVDVIGVTKAKGFQGVVKRHGFGGQTTSHGRKHDIRKPGSIGATFPEHVVKGRRMAGRMGGKNFTVRGLRVVSVDIEKGLIALRGAIPGVNGGLIGIRGMGRKVGGK